MQLINRLRVTSNLCLIFPEPVMQPISFVSQNVRDFLLRPTTSKQFFFFFFNGVEINEIINR